MRKSKFIKISIFIILLVLVISCLIHKYFYSPEMTIVIRYKEVPPILQQFPRAKMDAYYRGYYIGKVSHIDLSNDQKYILFYLDIFYKKLRLPKNIKIFLNSEDIYGTRHFVLIYPEQPLPELLKNGDMVDGSGYYERLDKYLAIDLKSGKLHKIVSNLVVLTNSLRNLLNENNMRKNKTNTNPLPNEVKVILKDVSGLLESPELKKIITKAPESLDKTIKNLEMVNKNIPEINKTIDISNSLISTTNSNLTNTNSNLTTINNKVPVITSDLLENADTTLKTVDCLGNELSEILSKRFLLFRLIFGNPGSSLKKCHHNNQNYFNCPVDKFK